MMSTTISNIVLAANNLNNVSMLFIRYYCFILIPISLVGHLMSIYVFTRPSLRKNSCSRYFLAATIAGLMNTCYTLPIRTLQVGFPNKDPGAYSIILCKLLGFFSYSIRYIQFLYIKCRFFFSQFLED